MTERDECYSLARRAWAAHRLGDVEVAGTALAQAEALEREITPQVRYLYSLRGIQHADHLRRADDAAYARRVTEANLKICVEWHWPDKVSMAHRVLGDLDADAGQHTSAREHYDEALKIARGISFRPALIEALLARGCWAARQAATFPKAPSFREGLQAAFADLNEALDYATASGYRRYEADIRIALAWAHLATGDTASARREAERARAMSADMGYHWGKVDAEEVLSQLGD